MVLFLVANKSDLYPDKESTLRPPTEKLINSFKSTTIGKQVLYYETCALKSEGVTKLFKEMSQKIESKPKNITKLNF